MTEETTPFDEDSGMIIMERKATPAEIIKAKVAVMKAVRGVGQTGHNKFHHYDYASSADVLKAVSEAMVDAGLALEMWPESIEKDVDGNMQVKFMMEWQHESGAVASPIPWYGIAHDKDKSGKNGDKWFNKAATAAEKYFFLKQFHIPSEKGFDPDEGSVGDNAPAPAAKPRMTAAKLKKDGAWERITERIDRYDDKSELMAYMVEIKPEIDTWPMSYVDNIREYCTEKMSKIGLAEQLGDSDDNPDRFNPDNDLPENPLRG